MKANLQFKYESQTEVFPSTSLAALPKCELQYCFGCELIGHDGERPGLRRRAVVYGVCCWDGGHGGAVGC